MKYDYDTCHRMCLKYMRWAVAACTADECRSCQWFVDEWMVWNFRRLLCKQKGWRR